MRLIDADELKKRLSDKDLITWTHEYGDAIPFDWAISAVDNAPTVTIKEWKEEMPIYIKDAMLEALRPQGKWLHDNLYLDVKCSICNSYALERGDYPELSKYCPSCGAEMEIEP